MQASLERLRQRRDDGVGEGGFTLIELLIVIVILGILAAIVVFAVQNLSSSSATASCGTDLKTVETALEAFKTQEGSYPNTTTATTPLAVQASTVDTYGTTNGIFALLQTDTGNATAPGIGQPNPATTVVTNTVYEGNGKGTTAFPVGPWLKDIPFNGNHYEIVVSVDGLGTVSVLKSPQTAPTTGLPGPGNLNSVATVSLTGAQTGCTGVS